MTTGVPIYLVSACSTGEEFVAAFRRYADRGSLFVPIAEPIPAGRRGRFALTLTGGGVLIEGDGEVISSSKTPSVLHGRVGMTIRFADLDDASKTMLIELEKARLVAKPAAPSHTPRIADLPAAPRAKPPAVSAKIDASIALAECVAIGDVEALDKGGAPPKAGPKFVVPTVPPVGAARPKTPSTPPEMRPRTPSGPQPVARPKTPSVPPPMPALSPLPKSPSGPTAIPKTGASDTFPAIQQPGGFSATMPAVALADLQRSTTLGMAPIVPPSTAQAMATITPTEMAAVPPPPGVTVPMDVVAKQPSREDPTTPSPVRVAAAARREDQTPPTPTRSTPPAIPAAKPPPLPESKESLLMTVRDQRSPVAQPEGKDSLLMTVRDQRSPVTQPEGKDSLLMTVRDQPAPARPDPSTKESLLTTVRGTLPPKPPNITPPELELESDEPTDLTSVPPPPSVARDPRKTTIGVAVTPGGAQVLPAMTDAIPAGAATAVVEAAPVEIDDIDTSVTEQPSDPPPVLKATVEEPTPSGDWTISTGVGGPTIEPRKIGKDTESDLAPIAQVNEDALPKASEKRLTGNWTIQLDSSSPDGWSEPSKVDLTALPDKPVEEKPKKKPRAQIDTPPELQPIARSIMMDSAEAPRAVVTPSEEPKVQIDPTLMDGPIVDPNLGAGVAPPAATLSALIEAQPAPQAVPIMRLATPVPGSMSPIHEVARPTPVPPTRDTPMPVAVPVIPSGSYPTAPSPAELAAMSRPGLHDTRGVTDGGVGFFRDSSEVVSLTSTGPFSVGDSTSLVEAARRRRMTVIGISAGLAVLLGIVLVVVLAGGGDKKTDGAIVAAPADAAAVVVADAAAGGSNTQVAINPPADATEVNPSVDAAVVAPPPTGDCSIEITSVPTGAEVLLQGKVLGTTPAKLALPCGIEAKLVVRKAKFGNATRPVMPTEAGARVRVTLQKLMFSVKVSSSPAGASISVNGKSVAVTPTTMKLPAFEQSTVTFSKPGFAVVTQKVTPKQNNQTVHAQLKRK